MFDDLYILIKTKVLESLKYEIVMTWWKDGYGYGNLFGWISISGFILFEKRFTFREDGIFDRICMLTAVDNSPWCTLVEPQLAGVLLARHVCPTCPEWFIDTLGLGFHGHPDVEIHTRNRLLGPPSCELDLVWLRSSCRSRLVRKLILDFMHPHLNLYWISELW